MQLVSDARAEYGREKTLVIGVQGLYKEVIIVMNPFKNDVVDQWRQDFSDYPLEIVYKKIQ